MTAVEPPTELTAGFRIRSADHEWAMLGRIADRQQTTQLRTLGFYSSIPGRQANEGVSRNALSAVVALTTPSGREPQLIRDAPGDQPTACTRYREERALSTRPGDFKESIKKLLADRAGHECSMPYCRVRTVGPGAAATQTARVGQASHIYSAGLNGPRGRGGLSDAQLADPSNGIWTCELHGKDVDNNKGDAFPAGLLRSWKDLHEARVKRMSTGAPAERWVEHVRFMRTPLFEPDSVLHLGKVTVIGGTNGAGKTAICEWLGAVRDKGLLDRWTGRLALHAINLEISFWTCNGFAPVTYLIMPPWPRMRAG